jgi:hypothetical protein
MLFQMFFIYIEDRMMERLCQRENLFPARDYEIIL